MWLSIHKNGIIYQKRNSRLQTFWLYKSYLQTNFYCAFKHPWENPVTFSSVIKKKKVRNKIVASGRWVNYLDEDLELIERRKKELTSLFETKYDKIRTFV